MQNQRKLEIIIYRVVDYLSAMLAWFLFFLYRKKLEDPGLSISQITEDPKLLQGLLFIPIGWIILIPFCVCLVYIS